MKDKYTNSLEYWQDREKERQIKGDRDIKKVEKELVKAYRKAMQDIKKEILVLYDKYAKDNNLEYAEACKLLRSSEYKEWRMDLGEYISEIENTFDKEIADKLLFELNTLSKKANISRLEEMFYQCDKYINDVLQKSYTWQQSCYSGVVKDNYYNTMFNIHKAIGVGASFSLIDDDIVRQVLSYPWSGRNWSSRIWTNRTKLREVVETEITQMIIRGESAKKVSKRIADVMFENPKANDLKNTMRLVQTEHAYFSSNADKMAYKEFGVAQYQFLATLDSRTCSDCAELDLVKFDLDKAQVGLNYPPMHSRCRSTTIPYIEGDTVTTRFARDSKGKRIEVSSDMTYEEWAKKFKVPK